ncbi:MAG: hypothetical protein K2I80_07715 [Ruminococcus sp.]|nr:hypothetical protein [Ruminococcus sp.]
MGALIFLIMIIFNIILLYLIIDKFLCKENICERASLFSIITKIFSVLLNFVFAYVVFWAVAFGLWLISADGLFYKSDKIYTSDFIAGMILLETAVFLPYGLNLLLYKLWYKKTGLLKWWIFPAIIIGCGVFVVCVFNIISDDFISDWSKVQWIRS